MASFSLEGQSYTLPRRGRSPDPPNTHHLSAAYIAYNQYVQHQGTERDIIWPYYHLIPLRTGGSNMTPLPTHNFNLQHFIILPLSPFVWATGAMSASTVHLPSYTSNRYNAPRTSSTRRYPPSDTLAYCRTWPP